MTCDSISTSNGDEVVITVVVPTYNRAEQLSETVRSLFGSALNGVRAELLIVDDGSNPPVDASGIDHRRVGNRE